MKIRRRKPQIDPYIRGRWSYEKKLRASNGTSFFTLNKYETAAALGEPTGSIGVIYGSSMHVGSLRDGQ